MATIKETLIVDLDSMTAHCMNGVNIKGARKVINDFLKENTDYRGGWTVWFDKDDGEYYWFYLTNPHYSLLRYLSG